MNITYETANYCEFKMMDAVKEYGEHPFKSALQVAEKHGVPVAELHKEYARFIASVKTQFGA